MPRGKNTISVQAYIPATMGPRLTAVAEHRGQSESAVVGDAIRDYILALEGDDTNRAKLRRIETAIAELNEKFEFLKAVSFAGLNAIELHIKMDDEQLERMLTK